VARLAQDQRCVCMASKGAPIRSVANSYSCTQFGKEAYKWDLIIPKDFQKGDLRIKNIE
jgi:hypothetical protein